MRKSVAALLVALALLAGCQSSVAPSSSSVPVVPIAAGTEKLKVGQGFEVSVRPKPPQTRLSYHGVVSAANKNSIVLTTPTVTARHDSAAPLGHVPLIGRMFKNTGVGRQKLSNNVTIQRADIVSVTRAAQPLPVQ